MTDIPVVMTRNPISGKLQSGAELPTSLQFPSGYFEPAVMPMVVVRPATNLETVGFYSADHYGYVGRESQIRICIQGGAYPYAPVAELLPSGATLGADPNSSDYMLVKFTPASNATYSFRVRVFDQEGNSVVRSWSMVVSAAWCVFVSPTGNDTTGTGTKASPWLTVTKAITTVQGSGGKAVILEDGTYVDVQGGLNTNALLAWNQRGASIDCTTSISTNSIVFYINYKHTLIQGVVFKNPPITSESPRWFSTDTLCDSTYQDNCRFEINGRQGTGNTDNVSCFFLGQAGSNRKYLAQTRCEFDGFKSVGNGWSSIDTFGTSWFVVEGNSYTNQVSGNTSAGVIWIKGAGSINGDVRRNTFDSTFTGLVIDVYIAAVADNASGNIDVSYNLLNGTGGISFLRADQSYIRLPVWSRRNTTRQGGVYLFNWGFAATVNSASDVIQSTYTTTDAWKVYRKYPNTPPYEKPLTSTTNITYSVTNYECQQDSGVIDSAGLLTGSYRTNYLGRRGHEIYKP